MKLFCFPHAGGFANYYDFLRDAAYTGIDRTLVYEYPGRGLSYWLPEFQDFSQMTEGAVAWIRGNLDPGEPFALFGHSMGAFVAYEAGQLLHGMGLTADIVYVSGQRPPCTVHPEYYQSDINAILPFLKRLGGVPEIIEENPEIAKFFFALTSKDLKLLQTYRPTIPPNQDRLPRGAIFYGIGDAELEGFDLSLWNLNFLKIEEIRGFEGDHFYLKERREELVSRIDRWISDGPGPKRRVCP